MKIDKNVPMPGAANKYPFRDMEVGDSFLVDGDAVKTRGAATAWGKVNNKRFSLKNTAEGYRCWRIK